MDDWFSHNSIDDRIYCSMDSKTRRFNPRLGQKSNPIRLKNWKIIMQSKLGTIGSTIQTSTWFSFLHSLLIQTENHTISTSFRAVFYISSLSARYSQLATTACVQITTRVAGTTSQTPWRPLILLHISNMKIPIPSIPMKLFIISKTLLFSIVRM